MNNFEAPPSWLSDAPCAQVDPGLFFPDKGGSAKPAKRICAPCPVREQCLAWVLSTGVSTPGIYGGTTEDERRALLGHVVKSPKAAA